MSTAPSFIAELQRRNVHRAALFYAGAAWLLVQVATQVFPFFDIPNWAVRAVVIAVVAGFPFAMLFSWFYEWTPQGIKLESEIDRSESVARQTGKKLDRWIIAVLGLAVVVLLIDRFVLRHDASTSSSDPSIAVLPLANVSADPEQQYFSDGLSEDLITALSQFRGLKVISRNSSFRFRDSKDDAKTIAAALGVAHLLEGSVRRVGEVVRISAELVNAADGSTLWSQHYDRPYTDLFKLQDEITAAVAGALKARLDAESGSDAQSERPPNGNLEAYKAYLQGKFHNLRFTEADERVALEFFETAIRLDPAYAQAYVRLCGTWGILAGNYLGGTAADEALAKGRLALDRAFALNPNLASVHILRGNFLSMIDFDWSAGEAENRLALQLDPGSSDAMFNWGRTLGGLGKVSEGVEWIRKSLTVDPLNALAYGSLSRYLSALGRLDEAEQASRQAVDLQPTVGGYAVQLVMVQLLRGNRQGAMQTAQAIAEGGYRDLALAFALQAGDDRAAADAALQKLIDTQAGYAAFQIAEVYALRKQPDQTFEWLDRARANRDPGIQLLLSDPWLKAYRQDPRFADFCRSVNLPAPAVAGQ